MFQESLEQLPNVVAHTVFSHISDSTAPSAPALERSCLHPVANILQPPLPVRVHLQFIHISHAAGQDPGFSNRGGATSRTHMWEWLRFCIAT